ncbi:MAG: Xaa-Pro dipeptidyl-peptidase [Fuerstiella sp.]
MSSVSATTKLPVVRVTSLLFTTLLIVSGAAAAGDVAVPFQMPERGLCGHRGASDSHPENTLAAFREAIMLGVQMIEFDVALTKDSQLVLMHDATVDRTTDGKGRVSDLTLEELRQLDAGSWKHKKFKGEKIPTLQEALAMMPENIWLNVHLKGSVPLAEKTAAEIAAANRLHQCFLACDRASATAARASVPGILICNMDRQNNSQQYVDETIAAGAEFIQLLGGPSVDPALTKQLSDAGVRINYCCANDAAKVTALLEAGVQFPLVDKVSEMLKVSDSMGIERLTPVYHNRPDGTQPKAAPVFSDGEAQVVPAFEDQNQWIHHDLWVETEFDSDGDGRLDRMHVSVTRQRQTDTEGLRVPVVYVSSPYFSGTASGPRDYFWDARQELGQDPPAHKPPPSIPHETRRLVISRSHWNDWLPRGFAVVHSASPGTGLSQGCPTIGGDNESLAPKAVIDWLNGRADGFTTPFGDHKVTAYWTTGRVGMTGTSYNGTIPLAAATTGVDGLAAIIPVAPNTSYYHYYRSHGLVRHPGGYRGEDIDVLYNFVNSGPPARREFCNCSVRDQEMAEGFDRDTGDYNDFWAGRDYLNDLGPLKAPLLMAHAFNDWNVMPEHSVRIYKAVQAKGVPVQCYFHQGGHGGQPPLKMMNRWFTRYLYDIQNGVEDDPKAWIVREHDDRLKPTPYPDYPHPDAASITLFPGRGGREHGTLSMQTTGAQGTETIVDNFSFSGTTLARAEVTEHRLLYVTAALNQPLHISGTARFTTRLACNKPAANFSVWLVSLPWSTDAKAKIHDNIITRGWADPQNTTSLTAGEPLVPGQFYDLSFDLQPDDQIIAAGQQLGLMVFSTDREFTLWPNPGTEITIDLDHTQLSLPVVGGTAEFTK